MNGADHYREAERLLRHVATSYKAIVDGSLPKGTPVSVVDLASSALQAHATAAQAHATLALVAATVDTEKDSTFVAAVSR